MGLRPVSKPLEGKDALSTISLVVWPHFKLSQRVITSTLCTLTFSRYVSLTVSWSTSRSLARKERSISLHYFGFKFTQFSSAQAVMLSRSSCIVDGEPWGTTSEIVMSSTYFQELDLPAKSLTTTRKRTGLSLVLFRSPSSFTACRLCDKKLQIHLAIMCLAPIFKSLHTRILWSIWSNALEK